MAEIKTVDVNWATSVEHSTSAEAAQYAIASTLAKVLGWELDGTKVYNTEKAFFQFEVSGSATVCVNVGNGTVKCTSIPASVSASSTRGFIYLHYVKTDKTVVVGITDNTVSRKLSCGIAQTTDDNILLFGPHSNSTYPYCIFNENSTVSCALPTANFSANKAIAFRLPDPFKGGLCDDMYMLYYSPSTLSAETNIISISGKNFATLVSSYSGHGAIMVKL